jgi:hypothetical protein
LQFFGSFLALVNERTRLAVAFKESLVVRRVFCTRHGNFALRPITSDGEPILVEKGTAMKLKLQTWVNIAVLVILFSAPINVSADAVSDWKILTIPD